MCVVVVTRILSDITFSQTGSAVALIINICGLNQYTYGLKKMVSKVVQDVIDNILAVMYHIFLKSMNTDV
jgi:hypothetical protein